MRESANDPGRLLDWPGCFNARDLGGLRTTGGGLTRSRAVVRSDSLDHLTSAGWEALHTYGIHTIVDLRNDDEIERPAAARPEEVTILNVPLDDVADVEFWDRCHNEELDGTPLYYRPFLDRKPDRCVAAVAAVAHAGPGGVVVSCGGGRDRTGLISLLLLALVGVVHEDIVSDYELSSMRLPALWASRGEIDQRPVIDEILARKRTSARDLLLAILGTIDIPAYLREGGITEAEVDGIRSRLLGRG